MPSSSSIETKYLAEELSADSALECDVAGPLAMDLAISPEAGRTKSMEVPVIGRADIVLVSTLEAGSIL